MNLQCNLTLKKPLAGTRSLHVSGDLLGRSGWRQIRLNLPEGGTALPPISMATGTGVFNVSDTAAAVRGKDPQN